MKKKGRACRQAGFTLVEILIVMGVLMFMVTAMTTALNPIALINKGKDATRKKDLARIKTAFEEYFNDKGCYPSETEINSRGLRDSGNCGKGVFSPWLSAWPCDPNRRAYYVLPSDGICPRTFKVLANLENKKDKDIPRDWYNQGDISGATGYTTEEINYGVSSSDTNWWDFTIFGRCRVSAGHEGDLCLTGSIGGIVGDCVVIGGGCQGSGCFAAPWNGNGCLKVCQTRCCGSGCSGL